MDGPDERWYQALETIGAAGPGADAAYEDLAATYAVGSRQYHTFDHASTVVDAVLAVHEAGDAWAPAVVAAWFHDAVYDPTATTGANEGSSALVATRCLEGLRAPLGAIAEVTRLIVLTVDHRPRSSDRTGALLCDGDLAPLGMSAETYDLATAAIRAEYSHVDDRDWAQGRATFLRSLLDRPALFHTGEGHRRWEAQARSNISRELEGLLERSRQGAAPSAER